jgi:hypothetical protein
MEDVENKERECAKESKREQKRKTGGSRFEVRI